jgi:hypothetical protein
MHHIEIIEVTANYPNYLNIDLFSRMSSCWRRQRRTQVASNQ